MQAEQQSERERFEAMLAATEPFVKLFQQADANRDQPMDGNSSIDAQIAVRDLRRLVYAADDARAALSHPSTPQGWQPIETCPHDGEVVDFWIPDGGTARARADDHWAGAHWLKAATHWSRLLSPPEQGGKG